MHIGKVKQNNGVTLIEVLVAVLVLSIGLVGVASLLLFSLKSVHSSYQTSVASAIALDVEEWLWESLRDDASLDADGCPDFAAVVGRVSDHWSRSGALEGRNGTLVTLPNLAIGLVDAAEKFPVAAMDPDRIRAQVRVSWDEGRFGGASEIFEYLVQVPCRVGN